MSLAEGRVRRLTIVSGPPGAGKTTVSAAWARRFERAVHFHTDVFFGAIATGYIEPWMPESAEQNRVCVTAAARAMVPYVEAGYEVFADGVVLPWALEVYRSQAEPAGVSIDWVVLLPSVDAVVARGLARPEWDLTEAVYSKMHGEFEAATLGSPHAVDTTDLDLAATVDAVAAGRDEGRFRV